jgi:hypothetical protein
MTDRGRVDFTAVRLDTGAEILYSKRGLVVKEAGACYAGVGGTAAESQLPFRLAAERIRDFREAKIARGDSRVVKGGRL